MNSRKLATSVVALALTASATTFAAEVKLDTDEQKTLYALGLVVAKNLEAFSLTNAELEVVKAGLTAGALKQPALVELETFGPKIQELAQARASKLSAGEKAEGAKLVTAALAEKGAMKLASGGVVVPIKEGAGAAPATTDKVKVHYHGTLRDGSVFDSSVQRKEPATFPLNGVISCWTEGLQKVKVGGKAKLVCPSDSAYGDQGRPPQIKGGATLTFEVELLEIVK